MPKFPYGKVPFWILLIAISTGVFNLVVALSKRGEKPDLVFVSFARSHMEAYEEATEEFQKEHGVKVQLQLVSARTVNSRLQNAFLTNANVPDVVEILADTMGTFTKGPIEDVGFVDLTDRLHAEGLYDRFVESRYSRLSRLGRIFALPHDVHPLMLCYRSDLVEELGIDVNTLQTWDDFVEMGRRITSDLDGDGNPDRYALDLPANGDMLTPLLLQRREPLFTKNGQLKIDNDTVVDTIIWYIHQSRGKNRIAFSAGWGQTLAQTVTDGLVLFYFCPDWRTKYFETDTPHLSGKMKLMP
ncbi:MAG: extracellular solute-binding protein, partial [Candidatus Poribacteria bacterium]|nr:extracellular solute-binding protein [Candidatus Poribacteria bacterium]